MAYRIMLERGWDPIESLDAIRNARPIADIGYATDALSHYHRTHHVHPSQQAADREQLEMWQRGYPATGLRLMRPDA
jgi:hypothetical protein